MTNSYREINSQLTSDFLAAHDREPDPTECFLICDLAVLVQERNQCQQVIDSYGPSVKAEMKNGKVICRQRQEAIRLPVVSQQIFALKNNLGIYNAIS